MGVLIVLLVVAPVAGAAFVQIWARQQVSIFWPHDIASARRVVRSSFGPAWSTVPGRGDDNFKPKLRARAPVLSISYLAGEGGGCAVDIWCSQLVTRYGFIEHGQLMWRKKCSVARALARAGRSVSGPTASAQVSAGQVMRADPRSPDRTRARAARLDSPERTLVAGDDDQALDDARWLGSGERRFGSLISRRYESPDTIAACGDQRLQADDPAAALFFFQKAIDALHGIYVSGLNDNRLAIRTRRPSSRDESIMDRYLATLRVVRRLRPGAPVTRSVIEVTHRMRTISSQFKLYGLDPGPYLTRLEELADIAPDVDVREVFWQLRTDGLAPTRIEGRR